MKKYVLLPLAVLLLASFITGCFDPAAGSQSPGTLGVEIPDEYTVNPDTGGAYEWVRFYLLGGNKLYDFGDKRYLDVAIQEGERTILIEGLPAGLTFRLFLSFGKKQNGHFITEEYGDSGLVTVVADTVTDVHIERKTSPFQNVPALAGKNLNGSSIYSYYAGETVYSFAVSDSTTVYEVDVTTDSIIDEYSVPADYEINSMNSGHDSENSDNPRHYINTTGGIIQFDGELNEFDYSLTKNEGNVDVSKSGSFYSYFDYATYIWYQRPGGIGGAKLATNSAIDWADIDLGDAIKKEFVKDFVLTPGIENGSAYFVTALGAFRLVASDLYNADMADYQPELMKLADFFELPEGKLLSIELFEPEGTTHFLVGGTAGAYIAPVPDVQTNEIIGSLQKLPLSQGLAFNMISSNNDIALFISDYYMIAVRLDYSGVPQAVEAFPFNSGFPGRIASVSWKGNKAYIAGTKGLVVLDMSFLN